MILVLCLKTNLWKIFNKNTILKQIDQFYKTFSIYEDAFILIQINKPKYYVLFFKLSLYYDVNTIFLIFRT